MGSESSSATAAVGGVWKSGNLEIWDFGNLEIWGPGNPEILRFGDLEIQNVGIQKMKKIKVLKNRIRSAQNVGKVWISRTKILPALFGAIPGHFLHGPKKSKKCKNKSYFPWWANGKPLLLFLAAAEDTLSGHGKSTSRAYQFQRAESTEDCYR